MRYVLCGLLAGLVLAGGCSNAVEEAIERYQIASPRVRIGMERDAVLLILGPTQEGVPLCHRKAPQMYNEYAADGSVRFVEVFFFRSATNYDGLVADDEFTPYLFHDGRLAAIGWKALGGPDTETPSTDEQHLFKFQPDSQDLLEADGGQETLFN